MDKLLKDKNGELYWTDLKTLDLESFEALSDKTRLEIVRELAIQSSYPSEMARKLGISKQKAHYHFKKLQKAGIIQKTDSRNIKGGDADFYKPVTGALGISLAEGEFSGYRKRDERVEKFLSSFIEENRFKGYIVAGSPEPHGEDRAEANDGHLASEIALKLSQYAEVPSGSTLLDTDVVRDGLQEENLVLLGGVLTNILTKKNNSGLPARFNLDTFPYREIEAQKSYKGEEIGVIAKTSNPENPENSVIVVAGIRGRGTMAAVKAFSKIEQIVGEDLSEKDDFYAVVEGRDRDGDGRIEDFEILETSNSV